MRTDKKICRICEKVLMFFANYICDILRMIMIEKVYSVKEIEFTMNKVKFSSYNQPWG